MRFEKFTEQHIPIYYKWRNDPEVAINDQSSFLRPMSYDEVAKWCEIPMNGLTFVVYINDEPIGLCAFMTVDERNRHSEISIVIGEKAYWSKGYGTEIMKHLLNWGFEGLNLNRIYLHVFDFNTRAIGLYEKMGFKREAVNRQMLYRHGRYCDVYGYGILRDEYYAMQKKAD